MDTVPGTFLPYGLGRSYGDACLNDGHSILLTRGLDRFIAFDRERGLLACEAGVSLAEILALIVPAGWFLPVTPGTKFVTVGGAIANDVHGKNHHRAGSFGHHLTRFELLRSSGERIGVSAETNPDWLRATVGGLGLTGLITWAEFRLKPVRTVAIKGEAIRFANLDEFFQLSAASAATHEYTVAWFDCLAGGRATGRGIFFRGNHADALPSGAAAPRPPKRTWRVPFSLPGWTLNRVSLQVFNEVYYRHLRRHRQLWSHYEPFFYPLDSLLHWYRIYGPRGFLQYQCVADQETIREILNTLSRQGAGSFLAVLKVFGNMRPMGILSFPRPGVTLALDFPIRSGIFRLLDDLDQIVRRAGGCVYPAKDARMSAEAFHDFYPNVSAFMPYIDPKFSSSFWRRVIGRG